MRVRKKGERRMRVALAGSRTFGVEVLRELLEHDIEVPLVVTGQEDKLWGKGVEAGAECTRDLMPMGVQEAGIDLLVSAHNHKWIQQETLDACSMGGIGYHPSLLPRHRGKDAVRWTIHMKDPIAGGTVYWLEDRGGADTGPILAQAWCHVAPDETASTLWAEKLFPMGLRMLTNAVTLLDRGERVPKREQDERYATWEPSLERPRLKEIR